MNALNRYFSVRYRPFGIAAILCVTILCMSISVKADNRRGSIYSQDNSIIDGQHGVLHVKGVLMQNPCRIAMHSTDQTIDIGTISRADFSKIGDHGRPVSFQIELLNCLETDSVFLDKKRATTVWSTTQPGVAIRFITLENSASSAYIAVHGTKGLGLQIHNQQGQLLTIGEYASPQLVAQGQSQLTYFVTPVRVAEIMSPGLFRAVIGFQMSYD